MSCKRDKYNKSGYLDMTAYLAIRKIEREEAEKRKHNTAHGNKPKNISTGEEHLMMGGNQ